jgi:DNA-binding NarL/FixJ family response regulator
VGTLRLNYLGEKSPTTAPVEPPARLLIVADVRLYREGLHASLSAWPQFSVVGAASDGDEAVHLVMATVPDIVIVDMATKNSLTVVRAIRHHAPHVHIVGFGVEEVEGEILVCAQAGLAGYIPCEATLEELVGRVESVRRGELLCTPKIAASLFRRLESSQEGDHPQPDGLSLSSRERQVLKLIDSGLSNKEIAIQLHIEVSTVKQHVHNVLDKLHVTSRMQAAARLGTHFSARCRERGVQTRLHLD